MNLLGVIMFIIVAFASVVQKIAEQKKKNQAEQRGRRTGEPGSDPDIRTARPRGAAPQHPQPNETSIEDAIRRLMGEEPRQTQAGGEAEGWKPVPPPMRPGQPSARRQPQPVPPRQMQQPYRPTPQPRRPQPVQPLPPSARPVRQRPARTPAEMINQPRRQVSEEITPEERQQRANETHWREEMERRKKQQAEQEAKNRPKELPIPRARIQPARRRLFHGTAEVRRAIILSEIIGLPRAMREFENRW